MNRHEAAGGVVVKAEKGQVKVLLIKDKYGHWTWPKGHVEQGEKVEETALREVTEETGLKDIRIVEKLGRQEYGFTRDGEEIFKTVHIFLIEAGAKDELVIQTSEIETGMWFSTEEALGKIEYKASRGLLEKGIRIYRTKLEDRS